MNTLDTLKTKAQTAKLVWDNIDDPAKANIALLATLIPSLILSKHLVKEYGWKGSFNRANNVVVMRQHKVVTFFYVTAIGAQVYFAFRSSYKAIKGRQETDKVDLSFSLDGQEGWQSSWSRSNSAPHKGHVIMGTPDLAGVSNSSPLLLAWRRAG